MSLPILTALCGMIIFGTLGVYFSIRYSNLKKKLSEKEDFTNAVVHELRAPITAIKTAAEMIVQNKTLDESQHKLAMIIDGQSKRLLTEISSFLDTVKMDAGHFTITQAPSDIIPLISQTMQLFGAESEKKHITLKSTLEDSLPKVFIDASRIAQVLNNLLSNSLKFTPEGGQIIVSADTRQNGKDPHLSNELFLVISVTDTGAGISEEQQKFLFTKFSPVHIKKPSGSTGSTGLGLYIAKRIVEAHGGTMFAQSTPQHGTTISFTLPVTREENKTAEESPSAQREHATLLTVN